VTRHLLGLAVVALVGAAGVAQPPQRGYPVPGPINFLPYYQPQPAPTSSRPPLSPYLNLLNGNNPALNYFYGVRPLLPNAQPPLPPPAFNPAAPKGFFQPTQSAAEPALYPEPANTQRFKLPPPGGPVIFGNSFGSSRAGIAGGGRGGYFSPQASQTTTGATPGATTQPPAAIPRSR
jgi:hypothetical protein